MTTRTRILSLVSAAATVLLASACGGDNTGVNPVGSAPGDYVLQTANGQLPFQFSHIDAAGDITTFDILSGTLVLRTSGTFEEVLQYHVAPPSPQPAFDQPLVTDGTFRVDGAIITFTLALSGGQSYSWGGTIGTGNVTYTDPSFTDIPGGLVAVYTK